jgi:hypothetical protein
MPRLPFYRHRFGAILANTQGNDINVGTFDFNHQNQSKQSTINDQLNDLRQPSKQPSNHESFFQNGLKQAINTSS